MLGKEIVLVDCGATRGGCERAPGDERSARASRRLHPFDLCNEESFDRLLRLEVGEIAETLAISKLVTVEDTESDTKCLSTVRHYRRLHIPRQRNA
jgi:hypothetical protein